jgi:uncharacterized membrane protein
MRTFSLGVLALLFTGAGIMHLVRPQPFIQIVPPAIPKAEWMVFFSGLAEIAGGIGILLPNTRIAARWGLVALLVAVFPANVYMAIRHIEPGGTHIPAALLWLRLPLQPLLIWWVIAATRAAK